MAKGKLAWLTHFSVCHLHRSDVGEQLAFQKVTQSLLVMLCLRGFIWVSNSFKSPQKKNRGTFEVLNFECTWLQKHKLLGEFHVYLWSSKQMAEQACWKYICISGKYSTNMYCPKTHRECLWDCKLSDSYVCISLSEAQNKDDRLPPFL